MLNKWKKIEKESGYAVYVLLPKKDERYRRRGIKVEPKWLGISRYIEQMVNSLSECTLTNTISKVVIVFFLCSVKHHVSRVLLFYFNHFYVVFFFFFFRMNCLPVYLYISPRRVPPRHVTNIFFFSQRIKNSSWYLIFGFSRYSNRLVQFYSNLWLSWISTDEATADQKRC